MRKFVKYHGLGNDFVIVDCRAGEDELQMREVVALCDRHRGIGADGVLTVLEDPEHFVRMRVDNADGSRAQMCGNGLRCVVRYLADAQDLPSTLNIVVEQRSYECGLAEADLVWIEMGRPEALPLNTEPDARGCISLKGSSGKFQGYVLSFGNPHLVLFSEADPLSWAEQEGAALSGHALFPDGVNVSFVCPEERGFRVVVHERGVGITQACGSGACAVAVAAVRAGLGPRNSDLPISLPGGRLGIRVSDDDSVRMEGPARRVFAGEVDLRALLDREEA